MKSLTISFGRITVIVVEFLLLLQMAKVSRVWQLSAVVPSLLLRTVLEIASFSPCIRKQIRKTQLQSKRIRRPSVYFISCWVTRSELQVQTIAPSR